MRRLRRWILNSLVLAHYLLTILAFLLFWMYCYRLPAVEGEYFLHNRTILAVYVLMLTILSNIYNCYKFGLSTVGELVYSQALANLISWGSVYVLACIMAQKWLNPLAAIIAFVIQTVFTGGFFVAMNKMYFHFYKPKRTVVLYRNQQDLKKLKEIRNFHYKWDADKFICCREEQGHVLLDGSVSSIHGLIETIQEYEAVFVTGVPATLRNGIVKFCVETKKDCLFVPHIGDVIVSGATHIRSIAVPVCYARRCNPELNFLITKRLMDVVLSVLALILISPAMLVTAVAIKVYDGGPIFYRQTRLTKDGRHFEILKFRSMCVEAEKDGVARLSTGSQDDRITPVGRAIRAMRIDEFPQLFNIIRGDMSIVGPRPERPEIAEQYQSKLPAFSLRLQVKAGLTGYAQIYGRYNTKPQDKLKMDLMYINNIGLIEDLRLIFATIKVLFMKESTAGVEEDQVTAMDEKDEEKVEQFV